MRKVLIFALGLTMLGIIAHVTPASAEKKRCDKEYNVCAKGVKAGSDAQFQCTVKFNNCQMSRSASPFGVGRSCTPGRGCRDTGDTGDGKVRSKPSKGKGSKFAGDESGWNGKYTTVIIRDKVGTRTITVKQGVPIEIGLMVLGPDGAKHHIWDLKLAAQLEALGLTVVYANDNTARQAYAKAKAQADASAGGGKKVTTRGDGSKIDQAILNGSATNTKGLVPEAAPPHSARRALVEAQLPPLLGPPRLRRQPMLESPSRRQSLVQCQTTTDASSTSKTL